MNHYNKTDGGVTGISMLRCGIIDDFSSSWKEDKNESAVFQLVLFFFFLIQLRFISILEKENFLEDLYQNIKIEKKFSYFI